MMPERASVCKVLAVPMASGAVISTDSSDALYQDHEPASAVGVATPAVNSSAVPADTASLTNMSRSLVVAIVG